jgi:LVIVD repeat
VRRALALALALALVAAPLEAQQPHHRFPRKWLIAGVGVLAAGSLAAVYAANFERDIGGCSSTKCVMAVSVLSGGLLGFMMGSEMDHLYGLRYSHAPPISLRGKTLPLAVVPTDLTVRQHTAFVTGLDGIELARADTSLAQLGFKARGLRGIGPIASDSARNLLLVGTGAGLYRFQIRGDEPGVLAYSGEVSALAGDRDRLALGLGLDLQVARVNDSIETLGSPLSGDARVVDLVWQNATRFWALTEDELAAYDVGVDSTPTKLGAVPFPSLGRRVSLSDTLAFVAASSGGVYAVDIRDPTAPVEVGNWSGARFAYDVAVSGELVYVAAGPEGMYVLRYTSAGFTPIGLSRGVGFVAAVEVTDDAVYALDRTGGVLRRIDPVSLR